MTTHLAVGSALVGVYVAAAGLILVIAARSRSESLGRNALVGARTRQTRSGDAAWRSGQRAAQRRYIRLVPVLAAAAVASLGNALAGGPFWLFAVIAGACGAADIVIAASSASAANAAARGEHGRPV
ncbi:hypothetical protein AB0I49_01855 [Streptomyces sp. NPDC050617]|uniref:hypothetical protein n=1 Tax=Streptomyces sp. NPDC050617 TaxID=3154628 RepID=UPI0034368E15